MTKEIKNLEKDTLFKKYQKQYRNWKESLNADVLGLIFRIAKITMIVLFFVVMPVAFTLLSTLAGHEIIARAIYTGVFYTVWALLFIALIAWGFCKDYEFIKEKQDGK